MRLQSGLSVPAATSFITVQNQDGTVWDRDRRSVNVTKYVKDIGPLLAMAAGHNANRL